jgi:hypothetical protein
MALALQAGSSAALPVFFGRLRSLAPRIERIGAALVRHPNDESLAGAKEASEDLYGTQEASHMTVGRLEHEVERIEQVLGISF